VEKEDTSVPMADCAESFALLEGLPELAPLPEGEDATATHLNGLQAGEKCVEITESSAPGARGQNLN
jgi:hypothetical protein